MSCFAKYFTEALVKQVSILYRNQKQEISDNMLILERQTDSIRRELNGAITLSGGSQRQYFMLNPALNVRRAPLLAGRCTSEYGYIDKLKNWVGEGDFTKRNAINSGRLTVLFYLWRKKGLGRLKVWHRRVSFSGVLMVLYLIVRRI
jgi:hypothetical protein